MADANVNTLPQQRRFAETLRSDVWWLQPLAVFLGFSAFIVYSTWAAFHPLHNGICAYWFNGGGANYLSPFFSPEIFGYSPHAIFNIKLGENPTWWPGWLPAWLPFSPAIFILWAPGGFRFTCYYYRGAYYKAFWADPSNCAVGEPRKSYLGEKYLPLIIQNVHRYFMYVAVIFIFILGYDAWISFWFGEPGAQHFGVAVGSIVMTLNVVFLAAYTFGCHSLRHLIGGFLDEPSKKPACAKSYSCVSCLNKRHMMWAWISLFWVGFTDVYIRLCAMGIWQDIKFFQF